MSEEINRTLRFVVDGREDRVDLATDDGFVAERGPDGYHLAIYTPDIGQAFAACRVQFFLLEFVDGMKPKGSGLIAESAALQPPAPAQDEGEAGETSEFENWRSDYPLASEQSEGEGPLASLSPGLDTAVAQTSGTDAEVGTSEIRKRFRVYAATLDEGDTLYFDGKYFAHEYAKGMVGREGIVCVRFQDVEDADNPVTLLWWERPPIDAEPSTDPVRNSDDAASPDGERVDLQILDAEPSAILRSDVPLDADRTIAPSGDEFANINGMTRLIVNSESEAPAAYAHINEPITNPQADAFAKGMDHYAEPQRGGVFGIRFGSRSKAEA